MSTSGGGAASAVLYAVMLMCSLQVGAVAVAGEGPRFRRPPAAAVLLWFTVAVPSLLQFPFPGVLHALERDPDQIREHGQWWRMVTSVMVQDGGVAGTVFNLVSLACIGVIAVRLWGGGRSWIIFMTSAIAFNIAATFVSPSTGAGNSAGTFTLATSVVGLALVLLRRRTTVVLAAVTAGSGVGMIALRDAHGEAILGGLVIGLILSSLWPPAPHRRGRRVNHGLH